jgi:G3E family GTPase
MRTTPLPIVVLTGFLGSGKTTLLESWLAKSSVAPEKSALVINDFGPVNIDALLLDRPNLKLLSITGGCVCCTSYGELIDSLVKLAESPELELVWMETSGLAEPDEILDHLTSPRLQGKIRIQRLVQVIDGAHYPGPWRLRSLEAEQLQYADWIVINKSDLVPPEKMGSLIKKIRDVNTRAVIRHASRGQSDLDGFWDVSENRVWPQCGHEDGHEHGQDDHEHEESHEHHDGHHHEHGIAASTLYFPLVKAVPREAFEKFLHELPGNVYRAKGFVRFAEDPQQLHTFQRVCEQQETLLLPVRGEAPPATGLVFIGPQLDAGWFRQKLGEWTVKTSSGTRLEIKA